MPSPNRRNAAKGWFSLNLPPGPTPPTPTVSELLLENSLPILFENGDTIELEN